MSNKNFKGIIHELKSSNSVFAGYPHRSHRTRRRKKCLNNKRLLINKEIDAEHMAMMSIPLKSL